MAKKVSLQLAEEILNAGLDITDKKIAKAQYDKSFNATILGVNQDFTDGVTVEEQEALIKKYSIPEVPDKDNFYTFKINGNYYVKSSNTSFKLYENVKIRVPNGNWDNMYIEVQRDTESTCSKWITSAEEPTDGMVEGDYWVKIDDEKRRNIIEVRKYLNGNWNTIDYYDNVFRPYIDLKEDKCNGYETFQGENHVGNCSDDADDFFIIGNQNTLLGSAKYISSVQNNYSIFFDKSEDENYTVRLSPNTTPYWLIENTLYFVTPSYQYHDTPSVGTISFTYENYNEESNTIIIENVNMDFSKIEDTHAFDIYQFNLEDTIITPTSNVMILGDSNLADDHVLINGEFNEAFAKNVVIVGDNNRSNFSVKYQTQNGRRFLLPTSDHMIIGNNNVRSKVCVGDNNLGAFFAIGDNNVNNMYSHLTDQGYEPRFKCKYPFMFGFNLEAGSYANVPEADQEICYYYGKYNKRPEGYNTSTSGYGSEKVEVFGWGDSSNRRNIKTFDRDGNYWVNGRYDTNGSDYAEYYEWLDSNTNNEDRRGLFVTIHNKQIKIADQSDDYVLGVVSANPSILGNTANEEWHKKYKTDIFETKLRNEDGTLILSEEYDKNKSYIPRSVRPEYSPIGTHGQLIVVDDGTCEVNGYCGVGKNGIGTKCDDMEKVYRGLAFRVTERLDDTHIRIIIK